MSLLLCLLQEYVVVFVFLVVIQNWFFITIFTAGGHNMNGGFYMIIAARTQASEIMHDN